MAVPMTGSEDELWEWIKPVAIALIVVALILGSLFLYTGNWPPMVVVESGSMQHSSSYAYLGDLNIGDVVLVKKVSSASQVNTYVSGEASGYSTYGEYGNVIIYRPYGSNSVTPIIHRAILYLEYNSTGGGYDVPSLGNIPASQWYVMSPGGNTHSIYNVKYDITLLNVGYPHTAAVIPITSFVGKANYSGFVTMGDHNHAVYGENATDQSLGIFPLPVKAQWIDGVAVGDMPYVGLLKLLLSGGIPAGTPANSIDALIVIIVVVIAAPVGAELLVGYLRQNGNSEKEDDGDGSD